MRKSILIFAATFGMFGMLTSCGDSEQDNRTTDSPEMTTETASQELDTTQVNSKELENTDMVGSGVYTGTAEIVDAEEEELYVKLNDTTIIELYFSEDTQIMQNGESVSFDALEQGQKLEVQVERSGDQLNPRRVTILE